MLEDVTSGLRAFGHLFERRDSRALPPLDTPGSAARPRQTSLARSPGRRVARLGEADALGMLSDYGIPVARTDTASNLDDALAAADALGYPVALKTASAPHKTDVDGVRLRLEDGTPSPPPTPRCLRASAPTWWCRRWSEPGVEMALGIVRDPQFGPLVMVAAGGILIETLARPPSRPAPPERGASETADRPPRRPPIAKRRQGSTAGGRGLARPRPVTPLCSGAGPR